MRKGIKEVKEFKDIKEIKDMFRSTLIAFVRLCRFRLRQQLRARSAFVAVSAFRAACCLRSSLTSHH